MRYRFGSFHNICKAERREWNSVRKWHCLTAGSLKTVPTVQQRDIGFIFYSVCEKRKAVYHSITDKRVCKAINFSPESTDPEAVVRAFLHTFFAEKKSMREVIKVKKTKVSLRVKTHPKDHPHHALQKL